MAFRRVTIDIGIYYKIWDYEELIKWEKLVIELERENHTIETIKTTDQYQVVEASYHISDSYLKQLISIHENYHEK